MTRGALRTLLTHRRDAVAVSLRNLEERIADETRAYDNLKRQQGLLQSLLRALTADSADDATVEAAVPRMRQQKAAIEQAARDADLAKQRTNHARAIMHAAQSAESLMDSVLRRADDAPAATRSPPAAGRPDGSF